MGKRPFIHWTNIKISSAWVDGLWSQSVVSGTQRTGQNSMVESTSFKWLKNLLFAVCANDREATAFSRAQAPKYMHTHTFFCLQFRVRLGAQRLKQLPCIQIGSSAKLAYLPHFPLVVKFCLIWTLINEVSLFPPIAQAAPSLGLNMSTCP